jgi:hypothetical protein
MSGTIILGDQVGDTQAPVGSALWVQAFRLKLRSELDKAGQEVGRVRSDLEMMRDNQWFRALEDKSGHPFMDFDTFCETPWPRGLGMPPGVGSAIIAERNEAKRLTVLAAEVAAARDLPSASERGKRGGRGKKATSKKKGLYSDTKEYVLSELQTHAPAILERYRAGEFRSAASARREAVRQGLLNPRKPPTPLADLRRAWTKASEDERATFRESICG